MSAAFFTTEDRCVLGYEDVGSGLPVIWQHGLGADRQQAAEVFPGNLAVRRITLECRGHGQSELGDSSHISIAQFSSDLMSLLDYLNIERAVVGGISLGAAISMHLAMKAPSRVVGLILARPAWVNETAPSTMKPYAIVAELLASFGCEEGLRRFLNSEVHAEVKRVSPDNATSLCSFFSRRDKGSTIELLTRLPKDGPGLSSEDIAAIDMPTLVVGNGEEYVHPLAYALQLKDLIADSVLKIVTSKTVDRRLYYSEFLEALTRFLTEMAVG
jgi:pimeloyl-ACP methyl ester carboxylesterase